VESGSTLTRLQIQMVLEGTYADMRAFIYQLETSPEFVVIDNVQLAEGAEGGAGMSTLLACAVCFGASDSLQFKGMQIGILVLLGFTGAMLAAFAAFFLYLRRRQNSFSATEGVS